MLRKIKLITGCTIFLIILVMSNCWFGAYQSAKLLPDGMHSVEPVIENVSVTDMDEYYLRGGLRYILGKSTVNHQLLVMAELPGATVSDYRAMYTLQYGNKMSVREDRISLLFEFGAKSDFQSYTNGFASVSQLFSVPVSAYTIFTVAPSVKFDVINVDNKLVASPCFGISFNCETGFSNIKIIPEISAAYVYPSGFFVCSGIGIPILFGSERVSSVQ